MIVDRSAERIVVTCMFVGCALAGAVISSVYACGGSSILTPPTGPGADYPCGVGWAVCPNSPPAPHRVCCLEGDVCGGYAGPNVPQTCPAGVCCNEMLDVSATRDGGKRARNYSPKTER